MPGTFSPPPRDSDPDMHHGTCVTHVPRCMPWSLTIAISFEIGSGENVPGIPGACATRHFTYLVRGPLYDIGRILLPQCIKFALLLRVNNCCHIGFAVKYDIDTERHLRYWYRFYFISRGLDDVAMHSDGTFGITHGYIYTGIAYMYIYIYIFNPSK